MGQNRDRISDKTRQRQPNMRKVDWLQQNIRHVKKLSEVSYCTVLYCTVLLGSRVTLFFGHFRVLIEHSMLLQNDEIFNFWGGLASTVGW